MTRSTSTTSDKPGAPGAGVVARPGRQPPGHHPWVVAAGAVALIAAWQLVSLGRPELVFPGPGATLSAWREFAASGDLAVKTAQTLVRCLAGIAIALLAGVPWGLAAGLNRYVAGLGEVTLRFLIAVPPIVFVVLSMIWLGPGPRAVVLVVSIVGLPLMVITAREAVLGLDADLLEMTRAFELSRWRRLRYMVGPGIAGPLLAALSVLVGQSLRITVMAELLAAASGIGHAVAISRANLETAQVFAWALTLALLAVAVEETVVRPLNRSAKRWQR